MNIQYVVGRCLIMINDVVLFLFFLLSKFHLVSCVDDDYDDVFRHRHRHMTLELQ